MLKKTLVVAATTLALAGATATGASAAYDLTGGSYTASGGEQTFYFGGGSYAVSCDGASWSGNTDNVSGDPASTTFTPVFSNCQLAGHNYPMVATVSNPWKLTVTGQSGSSFGVRLGSSSGTLVEFAHPLHAAYPAFFPCKVTFSVTGSGQAGDLLTDAAGATWQTGSSPVAYQSTGCPYDGTGTDGGYAGNTTLPGVGVDVL